MTTIGRLMTTIGRTMEEIVGTTVTIGRPMEEIVGTTATIGETTVTIGRTTATIGGTMMTIGGARTPAAGVAAVFIRTGANAPVMADAAGRSQLHRVAVRIFIATLSGGAAFAATPGY